MIRGKTPAWLQWVIFVVLGVILEHRALKVPESDSTLSHAVRVLYRTETSKPGRIAFLMSWGALTGWFLPHILRTKRGNLAKPM